MKRSRYSGEQIAYALRQAEGGTAVADVCRTLGFSEATFYLWKKKYVNLGATELRELRQLREENAKLKRVVADLWGATVHAEPASQFDTLAELVTGVWTYVVERGLITVKCWVGDAPRTKTTQLGGMPAATLARTMCSQPRRQVVRSTQVHLRLVRILALAAVLIHRRQHEVVRARR